MTSSSKRPVEASWSIRETSARTIPSSRCEHCAGANALDWIGPVRSLAEVDRVMVSIGIAESNRHASRRVESNGIDQLFAQQSHRCRTQDDDPLVV